MFLQILKGTLGPLVTGRPVLCTLSQSNWNGTQQAGPRVSHRRPSLESGYQHAAAVLCNLTVGRSAAHSAQLSAIHSAGALRARTAPLCNLDPGPARLLCKDLPSTSLTPGTARRVHGTVCRARCRKKESSSDQLGEQTSPCTRAPVPGLALGVSPDA